VKEFKIVSAPRPDALEIEVNKLLKQGWELHGGLVMSREGAATQVEKWNQAMVKDPDVIHLGVTN